MQRRDVLLLRTEHATTIAELSCERLYMQYQDARAAESGPGGPFVPEWDDTDAEPPLVTATSPDVLLQRLEQSLAEADVIRVVDPEWLTGEPFRRDVEALLASIRSRGGRVELAPR